jgi:ribonuclease HI
MDALIVGRKITWKGERAMLVTRRNERMDSLANWEALRAAAGTEMIT